MVIKNKIVIKPYKNSRAQLKSQKTKNFLAFNYLNKTAQLKIQQMAFMLMAVTLFFVLVGMLFLVIKGSSLQNEYSNLQETNAKKLASKLANAPEIACGGAYGTSRGNCVDLDKVMLLKAGENLNNYKNFWEVNNIQVIKTYPVEDRVVCTFSNYPDCQVVEVYERTGKSGGIFVSNFVNLCRKEVFEGESYDKCEIGLITASYEG